MGSETNRFKGLMETLENDYIRGDKYWCPVDVNKAYRLLTNWISDTKNISRILEDTPHDDIIFFQSDPNNNYRARRTTRLGRDRGGGGQGDRDGSGRSGGQQEEESQDPETKLTQQLGNIINFHYE